MEPCKDFLDNMTRKMTKIEKTSCLVICNHQICYVPKGERMLLMKKCWNAITLISDVVHSWLYFAVLYILKVLSLISCSLSIKRRQGETRGERQGEVATSDLLIAANFTGAVSPRLWSSSPMAISWFHLFFLSLARQFLFSYGIMIQKSTVTSPSLTAVFQQHIYFLDLLIWRL